ncbi:hypothetical protein EWB00_001752, partial [Schistosoma japonicum]
MSRHILQKHSDQYLKRQHSMKTDESDNVYIESYDTRSNSSHRQRTTSNAPNELQSNLDYATKRHPSQMNTYSSGKSVSPRLLNVFIPSPSVHSSLVAVSRVSQQPSFESYDSSMSATSWTSSNDPDNSANSLRYSNDPRSVSPNQQAISTTNSSKSPSIKDKTNEQITRSNNSVKYEDSKKDFKTSTELKSSLKSLKTKETFQSRKKNPLFRSITLDNDTKIDNDDNVVNSLSSASSTTRLKTLSFSNQSEKRLYDTDKFSAKGLSKEMTN